MEDLRLRHLFSRSPYALRSRERVECPVDNVMYLMRGQMAHERLTPEGHGANGIRVEKRVKEGLTVPVLCISYTCRPRIQCLNADLTPENRTQIT
jgi:hypothetical protein